MAAPKAGGRFIFLGLVNEANPDGPREPLGVDANGLYPGTEVVVREIVDAGDPGAFDDSDDSAVVEWEVPSRVRTEDGWGQGFALRALSIGVADFPDLFKGA